jgi:glycerol-3-phosphate acyltransferase PlsY
MTSWLLIPAAYLLGSLSFAFLAGKLKGIDLRSHGSGNLGATNAGRVLGRSWGYAVFALDLAKGYLIVALAMELAARGQGDPNVILPTAAAVILGHVFTCFHRFKGGKAVATSLGVLAALVLKVAAIALGAWVVVWALGYSLLRLSPSNAVGPASVVAALVMPFAHLATYPDPWALLNLPLTLFLFLLAALVIVKHRSNIAKLFGGATPPSPPSAPV